MRYYHRTSLALDRAVAEADRYFGARMEALPSQGRSRAYRGSTGTVRVSVQADGGHYTMITVTTDQVGESELDKVAKRFLSAVHAATDERHTVRGAY